MTWDQLSLIHQFHPPSEYMAHLVESTDGWYLRINHRHPNGIYGECPVDHYERLTLGEAIDVIVSVLGLEEGLF